MARASAAPTATRSCGSGRWQVVHRKVPLPLALSCELPDPGTYKAIDVAGTPVLITRDSAGEVHAMVNVCRHRGAEIVGEGTGKAHRLTCPYHAWSYDLKGCLLGVYGEETFGGVDKDSMGLRALPAAERAGLVFVSLDPTATIDLDEWLGPELIMLLEAMALDRCYHYSTRTLDGPNWKVVIDGYLEGYHFASLHRTTVYRTNFSNMAAFDSWGPHQRNSFALRPIANAVDLPRGAVGSGAVRRGHLLVVPRAGGRRWLAIAGRGVARAAGRDVGTPRIPSRSWLCATSRRTMTSARRRPTPETGSTTSSWTRTTPAATGCSEVWTAFADEEFVFGRNEPGVQHFHRVLKEMIP